MTDDSHCSAVPSPVLMQDCVSYSRWYELLQNDDNPYAAVPGSMLKTPCIIFR